MFRIIFSRLAICLTIAIFSLSCTIPIRAITTGPQNAASVPKDFDPAADTLLVMAIPRLDNAGLIDMKSTIKLDEQLQKLYPYPYKIVSQKELNGMLLRYSDTTVYRFALLSERRLVKQKGSFQLSVEEGLAYVPGYKATYIDFAFYDRMTKQRFPYSGTSTSVMRIAVTNLTTMIRKEAEQKSMDRLKVSTARSQMKGSAYVE